jgi:L-seryl-tRNA(Ser) seleniumtransferase
MDARRSIPGVDRLIASEAFADMRTSTPRRLLLDAVHSVLAVVRAGQSAAGSNHLSQDIREEAWYGEQVRTWLRALMTPGIQRVINATGVILHTNLGRAPLAAAAIEAIGHAAAGYTSLEYDTARGERGSRYDRCARLLAGLSGAEDALVVNNNAASLVLALNTFASGKEAVVSRGELVEIGGSFRVPDIMGRSGAQLVEVGTTNRTHVADYDAAISAQTGVLLKVHRSNFSVEGFTADVALETLAGLARYREVTLLYDLGSGLLDHAGELGLPDEPTVRQAVACGTDIIAFSGDKLLGGPQAGILLGRRAHIAALRKNPLCRALRVDKLTLAGLEATLLLHLDPERARRDIPVLRMLTTTAAETGARAAALAARLGTVAGSTISIVPGSSTVGGGAAPGSTLPTMLLRIEPVHGSAAALERSLRSHATPVVARIADGAVLVDLRTVAPADEPLLQAALQAALSLQVTA